MGGVGYSEQWRERLRVEDALTMRKNSQIPARLPYGRYAGRYAYFDMTVEDHLDSDHLAALRSGKLKSIRRSASTGVLPASNPTHFQHLVQDGQERQTLPADMQSGLYHHLQRRHADPFRDDRRILAFRVLTAPIHTQCAKVAGVRYSPHTKAYDTAMRHNTGMQAPATVRPSTHMSLFN